MDFAPGTPFSPWYPPPVCRERFTWNTPAWNKMFHVEQNVSRLTVSRGTKNLTKQVSVNLGFIGSSRFAPHLFTLGCSVPVSRGTFDCFNLAMFHVEHTFHLLI